ncbi:Ubiquitin [Coniochaeta hoffmannii]|uniref:Ubiquitin n=1 Tax=Coniochaeta hoffmannii TaxID=91930 RepID=A0AA38RMW3_9PEZI|nr:Ubiquitin [Coniochaeta hoffmannii]
MVDSEHQASNPAAAGAVPAQEPVAAVQPSEIEKKNDAQPSSEPIPPATAANDPSSSSSSEKPSAPLQPAAEATSESPKGKERETAAAVADTPTADNTLPALPTKEDADDSLSIEPSASAAAATAAQSSDHPVCNITLLLPTGARHPYKIDERYLAKRGVDVPDATESGKKDPFSISVYSLKELILREWRDEWNDKPASPSSIRLIHFGKLLDDKEQLKKYQFSRDTPNVVHMSVRPAEMMEEDEAAKGKSSGREGRTREGSGNCCVIL